jgi:hypothetical protein
MQITELFLDPLVIVILLGLAVYLIVFFNARKAKATALRADHDLAYACIIEPLSKAPSAFRAKFHDLPHFEDRVGLHLVRFGLFNIGHAAVEITHYRRPIKLTFTGGACIVSAAFGEALKTGANAPPPEVTGEDNNIVTLAPLHINGGGSVIFNLVVRGNPSRHTIDGNIDDIDEIRLFG